MVALWGRGRLWLLSFGFGGHLAPQGRWRKRRTYAVWYWPKRTGVGLVKRWEVYPFYGPRPERQFRPLVSGSRREWAMGAPLFSGDTSLRGSGKVFARRTVCDVPVGRIGPDGIVRSSLSARGAQVGDLLQW